MADPSSLKFTWAGRLWSRLYSAPCCSGAIRSTRISTSSRMKSSWRRRDSCLLLLRFYLHIIRTGSLINLLGEWDWTDPSMHWLGAWPSRWWKIKTASISVGSKSLWPIISFAESSLPWWKRVTIVWNINYSPERACYKSVSVAKWTTTTASKRK